MNAVANDGQHGALEQYSKLKLELAAIVRMLLHVAEQQKDEMAVGDCRRLLARLAEDRFNLAMVGQFSRGKSSLMNALLGAEKLPTGILPLTSVITTVAYGESERVLLQREGWTLPQEIRLDELPEYVTQHGNPGNEKKVTLAEIQLPHEMLRLGVHFIDTPGVASAIRANTRTTRQFLPEIDAAVLVTSFESPLAETELDFLREVRTYLRTVFIVVNKHDLVPATERAQVIETIRQQLQTTFDCDFPVFPISAREALHAKQSRSREDLDASGLPALEAALTSFLRKEKARELLLRAADRAESVLRQQLISVRIVERARAPEKARQLEGHLEERTSSVNQERQNLIQALYHRLETEFPTACQERIQFWKPESEAFVVSQVRGWFWRDGEIAGEAFPKFLHELSQKVFDQAVLRNRQEVDRLFTDLAGQDSAALEGFARRISLIPAEVLGESESLVSNEVHVRPLETGPPTFRSLDLTVEPFRLPWWFDLIPNGRLRLFAYKYWQRRMPQFIQAFQHAINAVLTSAVEDFVCGIDRQLENQIESAQSHVLKLIRGNYEQARFPKLDAFLERIQRFRETVQQLGETYDSDQQMPSTGNGRDRLAILRHCAICSRLERSLWDFMARAQYELSVSEKRQQQHATRSGFCALHTWQYETISSPQGVCAAYPAVLTQFAERLRTVAEDSGSVVAMDKHLRAMLPAPTSCEACDVLISEERTAARQIARDICSNRRECPPLCAYHLHSVLAAGPDNEAARQMLLDHAQAFERLAEEMEKFVLKHTAVRHHLTTRTENQAALAGLSRLAGSQRIAGPWRID